MAELFGGKTKYRDLGDPPNAGARIGGRTIAAYRMKGDNTATIGAGGGSAGATASAATAMAEQRRAAKKESGRSEKIVEALKKSSEQEARTAEATVRTADHLEKARNKDEDRRKIKEGRDERQRRFTVASWKKTNELLKNLGSLAPWNRTGGLLPTAFAAGTGALKLGGLAALMGARGLTGLATRLPVVGPMLKKLPAGFKPTSAVPTLGGKVLNVAGRALGGTLGAVTGVVGLKQGYDSIRAKKGQSFLGDQEGEGGYFDSRASDYLINAGTGALSGAAIGSVFPVVGPAVGAVVGAVTGIVTSLYADFKEQIDSWFASVGNFIKNTDWKKIGVMFGDAIKNVGGMIIDSLKQAPGIIFDIGKSAVGFIAEWGPQIFNAGWNFIVGTLDSLTGGLATNLLNGAGNVAKWIGGIGDTIGRWMGDVMMNIGNWISDRIDDLADVLPGFRSKREQAADLVKDLVSGKIYSINKDVDNQVLMLTMKNLNDAIQSYSDLSARRDAAAARGEDTTEMDKTLKAYSANISRLRNASGVVNAEFSNRTGASLVSPHAEFNALSAEKQASIVGRVKTNIATAADWAGVDKNTMLAIAQRESNFDPTARNANSSAGGLYQFTNGTWNDMYLKYGKKYGLVNDKFDPRSNIIMASLFQRDNADYLRKYLKREPTPHELYYAHFMGKEGAYQFIKRKALNPDADVATFFTPEQIKANKSLLGGGATFSQVADRLKLNGVDGASMATPSAKQLASTSVSSVSPVVPAMPTASVTQATRPMADSSVPPTWSRPAAQQVIIERVAAEPARTPQPSAAPPRTLPSEMPVYSQLDDGTVNVLNTNGM